TAALGEVERVFASTATAGATVSSFETPMRRPDGSERIITFSIAPLMRNGRVAGVAGTAEDITERRRASAELAARVDELARSNAELEQFAYAASHDLQEPLRTVNSFAQLLARRHVSNDPEAAEFIGYITEAVARMRALIDGLLAYSRVRPQDTEPETVDLDRLLAQVLADLDDAVVRSGAEVTHDALPTLKGDAAQLAQLLQNLVSNALKFRAPDRAPRVHVGAQRQEHGWLLTVRDNGIGIEPRYAGRVFGLFQRLHTRDLYPGSGIGLAICKKIVESHGGTIRVEAGNPGSVFVFTWPDVRA
ncbi:MAG TPA: ATP-binding protein, partial [Nevskiaceae bacterium]|nr:ATP-binding protein [Nevskiaceae bacterium]